MLKPGMFPFLKSPSYLRPSALGLALLRHARRQPWQWRIGGQPVPIEQVFARDGWLPAVMAGAAWELHVPWAYLARERFATYEEPNPVSLDCGFYLTSDPDPLVWTFPIWRHLKNHEHQGVVNLDDGFNAWVEGVKGSPSRLSLSWEPWPEAG